MEISGETHMKRWREKHIVSLYLTAMQMERWRERQMERWRERNTPNREARMGPSTGSMSTASFS